MSKQIAQSLLDIGAVALSPNDLFTWSSGIKSPIYCDNRVTLGYPEVRNAIRDGLIELIQTHFKDAEIVSGTATAGIPHAAFISEKLDMPMSFVRSKSKSHGKQNQIEGAPSKGKKIVVVEDLISTGGSSLVAAEALREAGAEVLGVVAIFTYGLAKADQMFKDADIPFYTLSDYNELIDVAKEQGKISESDIQSLVEWRDNLA
ncbi:orotate phosphoribosyltransferase [Staphylococcus sp. HMSC072B07]|uniref:orotate phosphoribosyltransferase n=1 Tax=Staphylococcus TaxID=1279 RepID=UPI000299231F|nr:MULTISPECIES: orotate phosphoribosyltransferase [Staphylococcus]EKS25900.1 orotate phosphoribosyltransferase [Staphylococcus simulans ACS-120-V-Sch1]MDK8176624.1 orotate phosphoribosyltransferase [Staphylococcus simulans]OFO45874.1 orotate phosphoribosyltransferase [Staphylococcus sp. HMSC072B07]OFP20913.1 orotate phosphoribosyltransferase [Staphylococcus sp. HMSC057C08]OHR09264.1 orotate phosphoribosyltransferase [Staphylococcus sp. HMSC078A12]